MIVLYAFLGVMGFVGGTMLAHGVFERDWKFVFGGLLVLGLVCGGSYAVVALAPMIR